MRWIMAAFYAIAGIAHLLRPEAFLPIVPDWVPLPREVILITGLCELAGSIALMTRALSQLRRRHARALRALRLAGQHQARRLAHRTAARSRQLVVPRATARVSAGPDLVGAILLGRYRLAVAADSITVTTCVRCCGRCPLGHRANPRACHRPPAFSSWRRPWRRFGLGLGSSRGGLGRSRLGGFLGQAKGPQLLGLGPGGRGAGLVFRHCLLAVLGLPRPDLGPHLVRFVCQWSAFLYDKRSIWCPTRLYSTAIAPNGAAAAQRGQTV